MNKNKPPRSIDYKDTYSARLICNNCEQEKYIQVEKGTSIVDAIRYQKPECNHCGSRDMRKALFQ